MKRLLVFLIVSLSFSVVSFAQTEQNKSQSEAKEFDEAMNQMLKELFSDNSEMNKMLKDAMKELSEVMDSSVMNEFFKGDIDAFFGDEFMNNIDSIDWDKMFEQGMKAYEEMDSEQLDALMKSFEMDGLEEMLEGLDMDKIMEDMDIILPKVDSMMIEHTEKKKEEKKLKKI